MRAEVARHTALAIALLAERLVIALTWAGHATSAVMRAHAYGLSVVVLVAVLSPLRLDSRDPALDGFPLSTYPMFAFDRGRKATVVVALALGRSGFERSVPPSLVATSETMQAMRTLQKAVARGRGPASELCRGIAAWLASEGGADFAPAVQVALASNVVDVIDYLGGNPRPLRRKVHVRCPVPGRERQP